MKYLEAQALKANQQPAEPLDAKPEASEGSVNFASAEAEELAAKHKLGVNAFAGRKPSGKTGYTLADVRELVGD